MGISRLYTEIINNQSSIVQPVDLLQIAKERSGIEILVDFHTLIYHLSSAFAKQAAAHYKNGSLSLPGGEYALFGRWIKKLHTDLESLGITLVWFVGGGKGSDAEGLEHRRELWKHRDNGDVEKIKIYLDACINPKTVVEPIRHGLLRPFLYHEHAVDALKEIGAEWVVSAYGDADYNILQEFRRRQPKAYAIFVSDTDFFIFEDSVCIMPDLFDMKDSLGLQGKNNPNGIKEPRTPESLLVGLVSSQRVLEHFRFTSYDRLIDFGCLCGNYFTSHIIREELKSSLWRTLWPDRRGRPSVMDVATWVRALPNGLDNDARYQNLVRAYSKFGVAIDYSRRFYRCEAIPEAPSDRVALYLDVEIREKRLVPFLMSLHCGYYWQRGIAEDQTLPGIEELLVELRRRAYRLLGLRKRALEFRRCERNMQKTELEVPCLLDSEFSCPTADEIDPDRTAYNQDLFHKILTHQEAADFDVHYFDMFGLHRGAVCYLLRYMLRLNWKNNLNLNPTEFNALAAALFALVDNSQSTEGLANGNASGGLDLEFYYRLQIRPTVRSLTIINWVQAIYQYESSVFGELLHLNHDFPSPKHLISTSVFCAFYHLEVSRDRLIDVTDDQENQITKDRDRIIENLDELADLSRGIYDAEL